MADECEFVEEEEGSRIDAGENKSDVDDRVPLRCPLLTHRDSELAGYKVTG